MKEAIEHYEAALKAAFPEGATGEVFNHWNEARKALAQPQGEPVAWIYKGRLHEFDPLEWASPEFEITPLYTAPPSSQLADAAVEAAIEATKEKAAKVCDGFERKKWEILAKGGVAAGLSPADCAAAIRSMK